MKQSVKRFVAFILLLSTIGGFGGLFPPLKAKAYVNNNIVTSVSNPSYGTIKFNITIPAHLTVHWALHKVPSSGILSGPNYAINSGRITNNTNAAKTETITVTVGWSGTYLIKSGCTALYTSDEDLIVNKFVGAVVSSKVTWTQEKVNAWKNGQRVAMIVMFGTGVVIDMAFTKGWATAAQVAFFANDLYGVDAPSLRDIQSTPIAGFSYQLTRLASSTGYTTYMTVYNQNNEIQDFFNLGHTNWDFV